MMEVLYTLFGAGLGVGAYHMVGMIRRRRAVPPPAPPAAEDSSTMTAIAKRLLEDRAHDSATRFRVVAYTNDGASARKLYENAESNMAMTVTLWDHNDMRGAKFVGKDYEMRQPT